MSLLNRLNNIFRVQSHATQVLIIAIAIFIVKWLSLSISEAIVRVLIVLAVSWPVSYLIVKIFDRKGEYSFNLIWKGFLVGYLIFSLISLVL